ncbi:hypothetical protein [Pseudarthrobacter sp. MEB009]|uniref:hypothetical protein n=1 Tax=Pseudarthrobacter sp. MEB009 TaxID=3040326 RepID=UPI0025574C97|nr:hypothetical protein [Pseudarthrobacter sp. MEB009]
MPSADWIKWVRGLATQHSLRPTIVVQVSRDNERALELAEALSADIVAWNQEDHSVQEDAARNLYSKTAVVVGDRLHGLIVAATEGAVPLGWIPSSKGKIQRHFRVVNLDWVGKFEGAPATDLPPIDQAKLSQLRLDLSSAVEAARHELQATTAELKQQSGKK